ncbi:MAG: amidohydrolase family protein, partial [Halobacteria archaeon]|nr:amidohydrolase family protein [Halobacteria archaeon]
MPKDIPRKQYTDLYGPTVGDRIRLGDTSLVAEIESDGTYYGDESVFGGGKTLRDGMGMKPGKTADEGVLDWVLTNAVVIDPVLGIVKGDVGIKDGVIAGVGSSGNPDTMDGVDDRLVVSANTDVLPCEGKIVTPGGIDPHVHFNSPQLAKHALASGVTTMLGGGFGGGATTATPGKTNIEMMLRSAEHWPVNFGFYGKGNSSRPEILREQIEWGA